MNAHRHQVRSTACKLTVITGSKIAWCGANIQRYTGERLRPFVLNCINTKDYMEYRRFLERKMEVCSYTPRTAAPRILQFIVVLHLVRYWSDGQEETLQIMQNGR